MKKHILILALAALGPLAAMAQDTILYKQVDGIDLYLEVRPAQNVDPTKATPAMIFFFGGGFVSGNRSHFSSHANYLSQRGLTCFLADYRIRNKHGTTPFESLKDAKSAMRFLRKHAADFNIDPDQIIAAGGSAGGYLAAATALIEGYNEEGDDLNVSCIPNALVLYNPVVDISPAAYGYERVGEDYQSFSPLHNLREGTPPTIFFLGTKDHLIPVETANYYRKAMENLGSRCDLHLYEGQGHGFFNYRNQEYYKLTLAETDLFLQSLGYLEEKELPILQDSTDLEKVQGVVEAREKAFAMAFAQRDLTAFSEFISDEAIFFMGNEVLRGREQILVAWGPLVLSDTAPFSWHPDVIQVLPSGSLALSSGPVLDASGKQVGRFNSIWRKNPCGTWQVIFDKGS